jgi:hypothetical protein
MKGKDLSKDDCIAIHKELLSVLNNYNDNDYFNVLADISSFNELNILLNLVQNHSDYKCYLSNYVFDKNGMQYEYEMSFGEYKFEISITEKTLTISFSYESEDYDNYDYHEYYSIRMYTTRQNDISCTFKNEMDILFNDGGKISNLYMSEILKNI